MYKAVSTTKLPPVVEAVARAARQQHQTLVLVTGVFDVLHREHLRFLHKARAVGEVLLVGLESDLRVKHIKGDGRPVNDESTRWRNLMDLKIADQVFVLPEAFSQPADYRSFIQHLRPQILAVSSHSPHLERKQQLLAEIGGQVKVVHQHDPSISTTLLLAQESP